jgi:tripartite-type tricarboxylate transporter receptor subunit TctC
MPSAARVLAAAALLFASTVASAQSYPTKPIRMIVPFGPGGSADAIARPLAEKLGAALGQSVVVDNRPGGLTVVGADLVAKSPPDGYTLFLMPGTHVLTPLMVQNTPYHPIADFSPIALLGSQPYFIFANIQQPFTTFAEMAAYAKANPGKISMGVSDSVTLVIASAFKAATNLDVLIIPYKGGGPQNVDFLGNQISTAVGTPNRMQFVNSGKARALSASTPARVPFLPQVPTIAELVPGSNFNVQTWYAIAGPAKMPRAIVDRLHAEIRRIMDDPEMKKRLDDQGVVRPADTSPEALAAMMKDYQDRMTVLVKAAGIKPE